MTIGGILWVSRHFVPTMRQLITTHTPAGMTKIIIEIILLNLDHNALDPFFLVLIWYRYEGEQYDLI